MRFLIAIAVFVMGLGLTAAGLVQQIENQPISKIEINHLVQGNSPYLLIPSRVLTAYEGSPQFAVMQAGTVFAGVSREADIRAWLGDSPYRELRLVVDLPSESARLTEVAKPGEGISINPLGQDIWAEFHTGQDLVGFRSPGGAETAVLLATDGSAPAPGRFSLTWQLDTTPTQIAPLIYIGAATMLSGAAAGIFAFFWDRRRRGPRRRSMRAAKRPKRSPVRRVRSQTKSAPSHGRRAAGPLKFTALLLTPLILSGCAPEYQNPIISPSPAASPEVLTPVVTQAQLLRILTEIAAVVQASDETLTRESLEPRVAGPALQMRGAAYTLLRRSADSEPLPPILATPLELLLPAASDTWPRSVMVVTGEPPEAPLQMLVLRQETARDNYVLWQYMTLLPGAEFPEVASAEVGAASLKANSLFLAFPATELASAVGDLLNQGQESSYSSVIDANNKYIQDVGGVQQNLVETLDNADVSFSHEQADEVIVLLGTLGGGALVGMYMKDTYRIAPKEAGDAVAISGPEALLLGTGGSAKGVQTRYGAMLLFYVPPANSDQMIRVLGATQGLLSAVNLE